MNEIVERVEIISAMPAKVATAVCAVMKAVPKLAKGETNKHGGYAFASIDDFLDAVRPLCADAGLIITQDEESCEVKGDWLFMQFSFTLSHVSGETWAHRPRRTIMVSAKMGAQAFGAAQSYSLKQFERSLFQIATGEKGQDADEHPPASLPASRRTKAAPPPAQAEHASREMDEQFAATVGPVDPQAPMYFIEPPASNATDADWTDWCVKVDQRIKVANSGSMLKAIVRDNKPALERCPEAKRALLKAAVDARLDILRKEREAA